MLKTTSPVQSVPGAFGVGGASPAPIGAGITFPSVFLPSTNPNTLDDYEEGTWVPIVSSGAGVITTVANESGQYTKIGNKAIVNLTFQIVDNGTGSGFLRVDGLPAAADINQMIGFGCEVQSTGKMLVGSSINSTAIAIKFYDFTYPGANGTKFNMTLIYQT